MSEEKYSKDTDYQEDARHRYIKYGGMEFKALADTREINHFVANLSPEKKVSMFSVVGQLQEQGLIELEPGSFSPADEDMLPFME